MSKPNVAATEPAKEARRFDVAALANEIIANVEKVIIGKRPQVSLALVAYFCEGHILLEDVPGVAVFNQKTAEFEFRPGPIFAQTVLADEINRTTPRTQSALLEAMAER